MYKKNFVCAAFLMFFAVPAFCGDSMLVTQPAYHSMNFYVYKPVNVPDEFFATYDGYLVFKDSQGIWNYASNEKSGIKKTGYVVGSVIPSVVKLTPYDAKISSVAYISGTQKTPMPITIKPAGTRLTPDNVISFELNSPEVMRIDVTPITKRTKTPVYVQKNVYTPPAAPVTTLRYYVQNAPEWTQNSNFIAVGKWKSSIDRIGVLEKPAIPVAWKGKYPEVIYAWTGREWRQLNARNRHVNALSTIRNEIYSLTVHTNKLNAPVWTDNDSYILSQYAAMWGYQWLDKILISTEY